MDSVDDNVKNDRRFVVALARGLEILNCFRPDEGRLGNGQLAERTGLPKTTISRLTFTLSQLGYLTQSPEDGKYSPGTAMMKLGHAQLARMKARRIARPLMQALAEYSQGSVNFAVPDGLHMVYIDTYRRSSSLNLELEVGSQIPMVNSAMGRAYISAVSDAKREELYGQIRESAPGNWPEISQGLSGALDDYRQHGYCLSIGDWRKETHAVAVPLVMGEDEAGITLFSCGGPSFLFTREKLENDIAPRLLNLVSNVTTALRVQGTV